jgi:hypothetical protein
MDLGVSSGGLPPDEVTEDIDAILAGTSKAIADFHDPSPGSMLRMGVAPCSPFSVTGELMTAAAGLARDHGLRLHTHIAETATRTTLRGTLRFPVEYLDSLDWLVGDVGQRTACTSTPPRRAAGGDRDRHRAPVLQRGLGVALPDCRPCCHCVPVGLSTDRRRTRRALSARCARRS